MKAIQRPSYLLLLILTLLSACSSKRQAVTQEPVIERPDWVRQRPIDSYYYIGVGAVPKNGSFDYAELAKQKALDNLASEIKVRIAGSSLLYQMDGGERYREQYLNNVQVTALEDIEGFEVVDIFETKDEYWVYYRLSKSKHAQIREEKRLKAISSATSAYSRGEALEENGDFAEGLLAYAETLVALENYLSEGNEVEYGGKKVYLDREALFAIRRMMNQLELNPEASKVNFQKGSDFEKRVNVKASYKGNAVSNLAIAFKFLQGKGKITSQAFTSQEGNATLSIQSISSTPSVQTVGVYLDKEKLFASFRDSHPAIYQLLSNQEQLKNQLSIHVLLPKIWVQGNEKDFGQSMTQAVLANQLKNSLTLEGLQLATSKEEADLIISIDSDTEKGGSANGFHTAYLSFTVRVFDKQTGREIHTEQQIRLKGVQMSFEQASKEAYEEGEYIIKRKVAKKVMEAVF